MRVPGTAEEITRAVSRPFIAGMTRSSTTTSGFIFFGEMECFVAVAGGLADAAWFEAFDVFADAVADSMIVVNDEDLHTRSL